MSLGTFIVFNTYVVMLAGAVRDDRHDHDDGAARRRVGGPRARGARHRARHGRRARRGRPRRVRRRRRVPTTSTSSTSTAFRCSATSRCTCARARRSRSSAAPAAGKSTVVAPDPALLRRHRWRGARRRPRRARPHASPASARTSAWSLDEPFLFSESIRDNIAFGRPDASFEDIEAAAKAAGADDFILELSEGYDTVIGERGYTLSGGQRQRIAIARTLLVNPRILMLDDATSAIDAQREFEIHGALAHAHARAHHAHHRPPALDDQPRRPRGRARGRPHRRRRHATTS